MKTWLLIIALILITSGAFAQNVSLKKDTIFNNKTAYAILKKSNSKPMRYFIYSLAGEELMEFHYSHLDAKERSLYVLTFLNDHKQAMIAKQPGFPKSFINDIVRYNLISNASSVNTQPELQFVNTHSLPAGYTDVDQEIDTDRISGTIRCSQILQASVLSLQTK